MKQKNKSEELATKKDLQNVEEKLRFEIKTSADEILIKVDENARKYKDEILTKLDEAMGEFETIREDNIIGTHQTSQLREDVDEHEKRIKNLEKAQQTV